MPPCGTGLLRSKVSLAIGYPTLASAPHSIVNGMKKCLALAAVTDIT